jgi:hypothetical protein
MTKKGRSVTILIFKKGVKQKKDDRWTMEDQRIGVADEINYLGVTFESTVIVRKERS